LISTPCAHIVHISIDNILDEQHSGQYDEYTRLHSYMVGLEQTIYLGTFLATDISSCCFNIPVWNAFVHGVTLTLLVLSSEKSPNYRLVLLHASF